MKDISVYISESILSDDDDLQNRDTGAKINFLTGKYDKAGWDAHGFTKDDILYFIKELISYKTDYEIPNMSNIYWRLWSTDSIYHGNNGIVEWGLCIYNSKHDAEIERHQLSEINISKSENKFVMYRKDANDKQIYDWLSSKLPHMNKLIKTDEIIQKFLPKD